MSATEYEEKVYVGVCEEYSVKNGWSTFAINVGSNYPVRLQTKVEAVVAAAMPFASNRQTATWFAKEKDGNENPNKPGTRFRDRYLQKVEAGATTQPTSGGTPAGQVQSRPVESHHDPIAIGDKERAITRMSCISSAAALYHAKGGTEEGPDVPLLVMKAAQRFERWVYRDIDEIPSSGAAAPPPTPEPGVDPTYDPASDDIPFAWLDNYGVVPSHSEWRDPWRRG